MNPESLASSTLYAHRRQQLLLKAMAFMFFGGLAGAVALQEWHGITACPLCILIRYLTLGLGLACTSMWLTGECVGPTPWIRPVLLLGAAKGALFSAFALYVFYVPSDVCGYSTLGAFLNSLPTAELLPMVFVAEGSCSGQPTVLWLPVAAWALLLFNAALILAYALPRDVDYELIGTDSAAG